jgi:MFS transporter, PPP family, 3-phenylpropionic acid transporter
VGHVRLIAQITARSANDHHDINRIAIKLMAAESQIPLVSRDAPRRFATWLSLFYGTTFGLGGTYLPFFPVWLKAVGIDPSWIGMIAAAPAVTRFTVLPFVTALAERRQAVRGAMMVTAFATAIGFSLIGTQHQPIRVFLLFAVTACVWTPMVPLTDAYALRGVARYGLDYGPLRLWGSVAFILGALACGLLVDIIAARHLIWIIAAMAGLGAVMGLGLQPLAPPTAVPTAFHHANALLRDPGFLAIILASALIQGSHAAYYAFGSITWQASGLSA